MDRKRKSVHRHGESGGGKSKKADVKRILGEMREKLRELGELRRELRQERGMVLSPRESRQMLEEIKVPSLELIREERKKA